MTDVEKRKIKKLTKEIIKKAIKDWMIYGNFEEWFWDRAIDYHLDTNTINYMKEILTEMLYNKEK